MGGRRWKGVEEGGRLSLDVIFNSTMLYESMQRPHSIICKSSEGKGKETNEGTKWPKTIAYV